MGIGADGSRSGARPCLTVASQLAEGMGERCESEIDTRPNFGQQPSAPCRSSMSSRPCSVVTVRCASASNRGKCSSSV